MEFIKELSLSTAPMKPHLWKRYVDDTCCQEGDGGRTPGSHQLCAAVHQAHRGGREEQNPPIPGHPTPEKDGSLDITVYKKPTHTDWYLNLWSHHPPRFKRGLVRSLSAKSFGICCDVVAHTREV